MSWFPLLVAGGLLANAIRLRGRLVPLRRLRFAGPATGTAGFGFVTGADGGPPAEIRQAAIAHARRNGLAVLDLIPADLCVARALDLASGFDPRTYIKDPIAPGRGAGYCTVAADDVLDRAGVRPGALDPGDHGAVTARLKQYAPAAGLAVLPAARSRRTGCADLRHRRAWLRGLGRPLPYALGGPVVSYALVLAALAADPGTGWAALAAYCAAPYIVFATGSAISPYDLHRAALLGPLLEPLSWWRTWTAARSEWELRRAERERRARDRYRADLAHGVARFLDAPRDDCPWCGSFTSYRYVTSADIVQGKPGRFTLERCRDCGHIFQNPRLSLAGLEFYYRDAYDGLGAESSERAFRHQGARYRARAKMVREHLIPRAWLDVGTGHGHFCRVARTLLPQTAFDGLDIGAGVEEAARRGWLRRGIRGSFPELVDELAGRYDVVSMHHYLEHTRDPFRELDAATKILGPGGHLLIEVPDPESVLARVLGRLWVCWFQPQHQHMIPIDNLVRALRARGMTIVARERRRAHQRHDFLFAAAILRHRLGPEPDPPWSAGPPTAPARARRALAIGLTVPLAAAGTLLDRLVVPLIPGSSNAYRVLARKEEG